MQPFRRHVARRADDLQLLGDIPRLGALQVLDQPEVEQLDDIVLAPPAQHHVLGLHIAMNHAEPMRLAQRRGHLTQDVDRPAGRHAARVLDQFGQRDAVEILHHVVRLALARAAEVVDLERVGMSQLAGELYFALEAVDELVGGDVLLQDLDCSRSLEQRVPRQVDRRHAAFADPRSSV